MKLPTATVRIKIHDTSKVKMDQALIFDVSVNDPCQFIEIETSIRKAKSDGDVTSIDLEYQPLSLIEIREDHLFEFSAFLSAVGGNLGLFLGFSLFSFALDFLSLAKAVNKRFIGRSMSSRNKM